MKSNQNIEEKLLEYFPDLNDYKFNQVLGQGGQAVSLLLDHPEGQYVGKVFEFPPLLASMFEEGKKIENESQILKELKHPNIPQVKEVIEGKDALLSIREYIPGKTLDQMIQNNKFLSEEEITPIMNSVLNILNYLHDPEQHRNISESIVHRDIKPKNIVINDQGVYLIDFGTSHFMNRTFTTMSPKGTFEFMAPEQFAGMSSPSSDIYGLGATIITALIGKTPTEIIQNKEYTMSYNSISHKTKSILERMVQPETKKRYKNVQEIMEEMKKPDFIVKKKMMSKPKKLIAGAILGTSSILGLSFYISNLSDKQTKKPSTIEKKINKSVVIDLNVKGLFTEPHERILDQFSLMQGIEWYWNTVNLYYNDYKNNPALNTVWNKRIFNDYKYLEKGVKLDIVKKETLSSYKKIGGLLNILLDNRLEDHFGCYNGPRYEYTEGLIDECRLHAHNNYKESANQLDKLLGMYKRKADEIVDELQKHVVKKSECKTFRCTEIYHNMPYIKHHFKRLNSYLSSISDIKQKLSVNKIAKSNDT